MDSVSVLSEWYPRCLVPAFGGALVSIECVDITDLVD